MEVSSEEENGFLWYIDYLTENNNKITVATTRPETLLGDTAIAVHPDDTRYQDFIGKTAILPIVNRKIAIIADDYVKMDQGTGALKITPAHDFNDYEVGERNKLEIINIFTEEGKINSNGPKDYIGLDRFDARKKILNELNQIMSGSMI